MKKIFSILIIVTLFLSSCDNWLDINVDPNSPSKIEVNKMLPGINQGIGSYFSYNFMNLGYIAGVYSHQLTTRESIDQYGIRGSDMDNMWASLYADPIKEIETLISEASKSDNMIYAGIGKIYKAYLYSQMVDMWGDIPYSEAAVPGNYNPKFDNDKEIYTSLIALLYEAIGDLENEDAVNLLEPSSDDIIYGGDVELWTKAARTILLKLYVQVINTDLYDQAKVDLLLAEDLIGEGEDFSIPYGSEKAPDNRNPGFVGEYAGGQISAYISPWFFEIMKGEAAHIFTGVEDPRIPYYFCTQLSDDEDPESSPEYMNGNFVSIYFGSNGVNRDHGGRNTYAMIGLYPVGGAFDSDELDKSEGLGVNDGTGSAPYRMVTYADLIFLKAELAAKGKISDDLGGLLEDGIRAAFAQVDAVAEVAAKSDVDVPEILGSSADTAYVEAILALFEAADAEKKFEIIMTQKWISKFGSSVDAYTDLRRTGYPVIFDPNTMGAIATGGPDGSGQVPVESTRPFAVAFPWSADELSMNDNAPVQKTPSALKVFWDN